MQGDSRFYTGQSGFNDAYEAENFNYNSAYGGYNSYGGYNEYGIPVGPSFGNTTTGVRNQYAGVNTEIEFQASENCPENFLIFDQNDTRNRMMYNPVYTQNANHEGLNSYPAQFQGSYRVQDKDTKGKSSSFKEDPDDIDALLSLEDGDEENDDDDVVSTGRTPCSYSGNSPDSISSTGCSRHGKQKCSCADDSAASSGSKSEKKKARMKKMVKALRGIVPGGQQMDTPAFLDEAVRYLKSLKVEVKKLGLKELK